MKVRQTRLSDYSRNMNQIVGVYGVQPSLFQSAHSELMEMDKWNRTSGLNIVEQLYTARGSQSMGIGALITNQANFDTDDYR